MTEESNVSKSVLPDVVLLDDDLVARDQATISAFDRGVMYGESVFETLKVLDGAPCLWREHRERLARGCAELGLPVDSDSLWRGVARLLEIRPLDFGVLRIQVTGGVQPGGGRGMTAPLDGRVPRIVASVSESVPPAAKIYGRGVRVATTDMFVRPLPWLKSGSYLASVRAKVHADSVDAFECLLVGGAPPAIVEGSFSNVLLWGDREVVSPPPEGRLPGVTLEVVLSAAREMGFAVSERQVTLDEARRRGLLLTGSLLGVCPCSHLDDEPLADLSEVAAGLRGRLWEYEKESLARWRTEWTATM